MLILQPSLTPGIRIKLMHQRIEGMLSNHAASLTVRRM